MLDKSAKLQQVRFIKNIKIVNLKPGQKMYDLDSSFNLVLKGKMRNNHSGLEYNHLVPFADFPIQVNINITSKDDVFLSKK